MIHFTGLNSIEPKDSVPGGFFTNYSRQARLIELYSSAFIRVHPRFFQRVGARLLPNLGNTSEESLLANQIVE